MNTIPAATGVEARRCKRAGASGSNHRTGTESRSESADPKVPVTAKGVGSIAGTVKVTYNPPATSW